MKFTVTWTNWTFGFWVNSRKGHKTLSWGIDLGPVEMICHTKQVRNDQSEKV